MQTVHVRVNDAATGKPTPCRIRFTDAEGRYYAPFGRLTEFSTSDREDVGGNLQLGDKKYAYIDGACEIALSAGTLRVEIHRGLEYKPVDQTISLVSGKLALRFTIERWADLRSEGWYSGDGWVLGLTPHAALLEGGGEDLAVVNILAEETQIVRDDGKLRPPSIPNILAFSGQRPALEGHGCLVVVNTVNEHPVLGRLALLNCHRVVYPLTFGGPEGRDDWILADWCDQCHRKAGLVVAHDFFGHGAGYHHGEVLADLILGKVDALDVNGGLDASALQEWHELLNMGFRVPLVGGSGKLFNRDLLGSPRTYARLQPGQEFTYKNWIEAVRAGRTFVTNGPLLSFTVNDQNPGAVLDLPCSPPNVRVRAEARSLFPFTRLEVTYNGAVIAQAEASGSPSRAFVDADVPITGPGWMAARCGGAQASPIYLRIDGQAPAANAVTAAPLMARLNEMLDWVAREARCDDQQRQRLAGVFEAARQELLRRVV
jgi:hypothetical protein